MIKSIMRICFALFLGLLFLHEPRVLASQREVGNKTVFFKGANVNNSAQLTAYSELPENETALNPQENLKTVKEFTRWTKKFLNENYCPSDEFIAENIKLLPAKGARNKDAAFLTFRSFGRNHMIVQTGGLGARMYLFIERDEEKEIDDNAQAQGIVIEMLQRYIRSDQRAYLRPFSLQKKQDLYVSTPKPGQTRKSRNVIKCFLGRKEICFSLQKKVFEERGPRRAMVPSGDEWFSHNRKRMRKPDSAHETGSVDDQVEEPYSERRQNRLESIKASKGKQE